MVTARTNPEVPWSVQSTATSVKYERTLFEPEHDLFRESYRAFLDRHVAPYHDQWEKDKIVDRGVWLEAGKQGFLGMAVPEEYGGGGNPDFRYNTIITEETTAGRYSGLGFACTTTSSRRTCCG